MAMSMGCTVFTAEYLVAEKEREEQSLGKDAGTDIHKTTVDHNQLFKCPMGVTTGQGEVELILKREVRMGDNVVAVPGVQILLTHRSLRRPS